MDENIDEDNMDEENKKYRIIKYHQHGILGKVFDPQISIFFRRPRKRV
jgi:hypothetical protein